MSQYLLPSGQLLLPMVALIEQAQMAVEDCIGVLGRTSLEAVLRLSEGTVAGPAHQARQAVRSGGTGTRQT